jgi:hypothetical protein
VFVVAEVRSGGMVGELGMLAGEPATETCRAKTQVQRERGRESAPACARGREGGRVREGERRRRRETKERREQKKKKTTKKKRGGTERD